MGSCCIFEKYAATEKAERLKQAIRDGIINVDMSLGSILTGISRQEELMHILMMHIGLVMKWE